MAGTFTSICCCEESLHIQGIWAPSWARPGGTCRGQNNRSVTPPGEYFVGGASAVRISSRRDREVRCRTTAHQSSCSSFPLGQEELGSNGTISCINLWSLHYHTQDSILS